MSEEIPVIVNVAFVAIIVTLILAFVFWIQEY